MLLRVPQRRCGRRRPCRDAKRFPSPRAWSCALSNGSQEDRPGEEVSPGSGGPKTTLTVGRSGLPSGELASWIWDWAETSS